MYFHPLFFCVIWFLECAIGFVSIFFSFFSYFFNIYLKFLFLSTHRIFTALTSFHVLIYFLVYFFFFLFWLSQTTFTALTADDSAEDATSKALLSQYIHVEHVQSIRDHSETTYVYI